MRKVSPLHRRIMPIKASNCCNKYLASRIINMHNHHAQAAPFRLAYSAMASLKNEIEQQRPFSSPEEEALLNLIRTSDAVQRAFQHRTRGWGVTSTQYNVLRILRGAHPDGLTCAAIGSRMITAEPDITRLLSRLKALKLIRQNRDRNDRRVVWTQISAAGLELLHSMDPEIERIPVELLGHLSPTQLTDLTRLLEFVRNHSGDTLSCDGTSTSK
jgi:DNA-binding MarR family transcriptional regulator